MMTPLLSQNGMSLDGRIADALTLMGVGMAVVFTALVLLWLAIGLMDSLTNRPGRSDTTPGVSEGESKRPSDPVSQDPHLLAVLTAAATVAVGQRVRLRKAHVADQESDASEREASGS